MPSNNVGPTSRRITMKERIPFYLGAIAVIACVMLMRWGCGRDTTDFTATDDTSQILAHIDALASRGNPADVNVLTNFTTHSDERVVLAAIYALGTIGDSTAVDVLSDLATQVSIPDIRSAAADALARAGNSSSTAQLIEMIKHDQDARVRAGAARGLARRASPENNESVPVFFAALRDPAPDVRAWAIRGIRRVSVIRVLYDPAKPPEQQESQIQTIEEMLRKMGHL